MEWRKILLFVGHVHLEALQGFYMHHPRMPRGTYFATPTLQMRRLKNRVLSHSLKETRLLHCGRMSESSVGVNPCLCELRHPAPLTFSWSVRPTGSNA